MNKKRNYSKENIINEVQATMNMENLKLTEEEIKMLREYQGSNKSKKESIRQSIIKKFMQ